MGLGKTVQSIAFLCHIAETYCMYLILQSSLMFDF